MLQEALDVWNALKGKITQLFHELNSKGLQCERYDVTTAPNGSVIGVTKPFSDTELFIPYSWECSSAKVGDSVLVAWWGNSLSTARAWFKGSGSSGNQSFVTEAGRSAGWDYRKWSNGDVDLWGNFFPEITEETTSGSLHVSSATDITLPFAVYPMTSGGRAVITGVATSYCWIANTSITNTESESHISFRVLRGTSTTISSLRMQFYVHGKLSAPPAAMLGAFGDSNDDMDGTE